MPHETEQPLQNCTVLKLGGSLLDLPDLVARLDSVLRRYSYPVLFVGGGEASDLVRTWQGQMGFDDAAAHDLAMHSLGLTARLIQQRLRTGRLCNSLESVAASLEMGELPIIDPDPWFAQSPGWFSGVAKAPAVQLPKSWDVTSDALAASAALDLQAHTLVLLKSVDLPPECRLQDLPGRGLVDDFFPQLASRVSHVEWINLRSEPLQPQPIERRLLTRP